MNIIIPEVFLDVRLTMRMILSQDYSLVYYSMWAIEGMDFVRHSMETGALWFISIETTNTSLKQVGSLSLVFE